MVDGAARFAARAFSFDRLVVSGLLLIVALSMLASFLIPFIQGPNERLAEMVLEFNKNVVMILVGALANSVQHRAEHRVGDRKR